MTEMINPIAQLDEATYESKLLQLQQENEYQLLKVEADTKIKGAELRANLEKLLRVMFIREAHERLEPKRQFSRWCQESGIDLSYAYREMEKIGDLRRETILSFGKYVSFDPNKIRRLLIGDFEYFSENRKIAITDGKLMIGDEEVDMNPQEVKVIIEAHAERLRKLEEEKASEKEEVERQKNTVERELKSVRRELDRIKRQAQKTGRPPEEIAFVKAMEDVRHEFDSLMEGIDLAGYEAAGVVTTPMISAAELTINYIKKRLDDVWLRKAGEGNAQAQA